MELNEKDLIAFNKRLLIHHINAIDANDLNELLADYTEASVLITMDTRICGLKEIGAFFKKFIRHFPKEGSSFFLDRVVVEAELIYILWHAKTPSLTVDLGSDTFIIKDGKILQQTFAGILKVN